MARVRAEDRVRIEVQVGPGEVEGHWWAIEQPSPSVSLALRLRIGAALGPFPDYMMREFSRLMDPDAEAALEVDTKTVGDALALQAFRRARSGQSIQDGDQPAHGVSMTLLAVARLIAHGTGGRVDGPLLLGVHERNTDRDGDSLGFKWPGPSLLHRLLLDSRLRYLGAASKPREPSGVVGEDDHPGHDLAEAVARGQVAAFVNALDETVSGPDELTLLVAWALLHLWRPF